MDEERRIMSPNGRREGDLFFRNLCEQRQEACNRMHKALHEEIGEVKKDVGKLDRRLFLILTAVLAQFLTFVLGILLLIFEPVATRILVVCGDWFKFLG
jgi:hypothetical protein